MPLLLQSMMSATAISFSKKLNEGALCLGLHGDFDLLFMGEAQSLDAAGRRQHSSGLFTNSRGWPALGLICARADALERVPFRCTRLTKKLGSPRRTRRKQQTPAAKPQFLPWRLCGSRFTTKSPRSNDCGFAASSEISVSSVL